jgi:hypothetical protein
MESNKASQADEILGQLMVKDRLLTDAQLNTALDFQRAVGGSLADVIGRLKFVEPSRMQSFLARSGHVDGGAAAGRNRQGAGHQQRSDMSGSGAFAAPPGRGSGATRGGEAGPSIDGRAGDAARSDGAENEIVLEALIRLLVRKGIIEPHELKEELLQRHAAQPLSVLEPR